MTRPRSRGRGPARASARPSAAPVEQTGVLTIDSIAAGGDGVGRLDGMAIFVPRTAPGDVVQIAYTAHARHGRGRVLQVLTPSPHRVPPTCVHYEADRCGGCQLQHLTVEAQREARQAIVQQTLRRIGRRDVPLPELTSGVAWGYRSRLTLALQRRGRSWVGGLHPHDDARRVFALETCPIAHPSLVEAWHQVRAVLQRTAASATAALPAVDTLRLALRLAGSRGDGVVAVVVGGHAWEDGPTWGAAVLAGAPRVSAVWWMAEGAAPVLLASRASAVVADAVGASVSALQEEMPAADETIATYGPTASEALAFAQVNADVAAALRRTVEDEVRAFAPRTVVDGYAGTGPLAMALVASGIAVDAIEADTAAVHALDTWRATADGAVQGRLRVHAARVEEVLPRLVTTPDVVVLNPPRRGVHPDVTTWLDAAPAAVRGAVYVSCDPATLARDLARLPSWEIRSVVCFDMFPQTAHVETVCVLQRRLGGETA